MTSRPRIATSRCGVGSLPSCGLPYVVPFARYSVVRKKMAALLPPSALPHRVELPAWVVAARARPVMTLAPGDSPSRPSPCGVPLPLVAAALTGPLRRVLLQGHEPGGAGRTAQAAWTRRTAHTGNTRPWMRQAGAMVDWRRAPTSRGMLVIRIDTACHQR